MVDCLKDYLNLSEIVSLSLTSTECNKSFKPLLKPIKYCYRKVQDLISWTSITTPTKLQTLCHICENKWDAKYFKASYLYAEHIIHQIQGSLGVVNRCVSQCAKFKRPKILKLLLSRGASANPTGSSSVHSDRLPLCLATSLLNDCGQNEEDLVNRASECIQLLLEAGAELESRDRVTGYTPLLYALEKNIGNFYSYQLIKILIDSGCDVNACTEAPEYYSALSLAVGNRHSSLVAKLMVEKGALLQLENEANRSEKHLRFLKQGLEFLLSHDYKTEPPAPKRPFS